MKAALLEAVGQLKLIEAARPVPKGPTEVLIKVGAVGICGSEIHAFKGTHPFRKPPSILGHEVTGDVVTVNAGVRGFSPGDRVFVDPQWACGSCKWCRSGRHNLCPFKKVLGVPEWSGGLAEYIVAPVESLYPLPDHVSYLQGTLIEPLSVAVHAVSRAGVGPGHTVAVLGAGPIGMMVAAVARVRGAARIVAVDLHPHCLETVQRHFGAHHGLPAGDGDIFVRVLDIMGGQGVDVVFVTAGVSALVDDALQVVEPGGRILLLALFDEPIQFEAFEVVGRDVTLVGSQMYNADDIKTALGLVSSGTVPVEAMVTHVLPLEQVQHGFDIAATKTDRAIKVVLEP